MAKEKNKKKNMKPMPIPLIVCAIRPRKQKMNTEKNKAVLGAVPHHPPPKSRPGVPRPVKRNAALRNYEKGVYPLSGVERSREKKIVVPSQLKPFFFRRTEVVVRKVAKRCRQDRNRMREKKRGCPSVRVVVEVVGCQKNLVLDIRSTVGRIGRETKKKAGSKTVKEILHTTGNCRFNGINAHNAIGGGGQHRKIQW